MFMCGHMGSDGLGVCIHVLRRALGGIHPSVGKKYVGQKKMTAAKEKQN